MEKELKIEAFLLMDKSRLEEITDAVSKVFCLNKKKIIGPSRIRHYVEARHTVMHFARLEVFTCWVIGAHLGWRDHSTVVSGSQVVANTLLLDKNYIKKYNKIAELINAKAIEEVQRNIK